MKLQFSKLLFSLLMLSFCVHGATFKLAQYNLLNISAIHDTWTSHRLEYIETALFALDADIIASQEIMDEEGAILILDILQDIHADFQMATFIDGPDTDNMLFYRSSLFELERQTSLVTELRDIEEYQLTSGPYTLYIYSAHLKASSGGSNARQRARESQVLRNRLETMPAGTNYILCGDLNLYGASESAWEVLTESGIGQLIDPIDSHEDWHEDASCSHIHTQSTRTEAFFGGSTGGMDDRFDFILVSPSLMEPDGISYIEDTYSAFGNDGMHFDDAINDYPTPPVGSVIADALHAASDHLPVLCQFNAPDLSIAENHQQFSGFRISPNPFNSYCQIQGQNTRIRIFDISGKLVDELEKTNIWSPQASLPSGVYTFISDDGQNTRGLLIR